MTLRTLRKRNLANNIIHVKDGQEALDWLFGLGAFAGRDPSQHPNVALLDLKLPKVDGLEVLRAIRADERTKFIPVVVMTSSREEQDLVRSYELGANAYVVKPVKFNEFVEAVKQVGVFWAIINQPPPAGPPRVKSDPS